MPFGRNPECPDYPDSQWPTLVDKWARLENLTIDPLPDNMTPASILVLQHRLQMPGDQYFRHRQVVGGIDFGHLGCKLPMHAFVPLAEMKDVLRARPHGWVHRRVIGADRDVGRCDRPWLVDRHLLVRDPHRMPIRCWLWTDHLDSVAAVFKALGKLEDDPIAPCSEVAGMMKTRLGVVFIGLPLLFGKEVIEDDMWKRAEPRCTGREAGLALHSIPSGDAPEQACRSVATGIGNGQLGCGALDGRP